MKEIKNKNDTIIDTLHEQNIALFKCSSQVILDIVEREKKIF